jgi:hypothetical protein
MPTLFYWIRSKMLYQHQEHLINFIKSTVQYDMPFWNKGIITKQPAYAQDRFKQQKQEENKSINTGA